MNIIKNKEHAFWMLKDAEPDRFIITETPWHTAILIDRWFEYYDNPTKE